MTDAVISDAGRKFGLGQFLRNTVRSVYWKSSRKRAIVEDTTAKNDTDQFADLMEKIDNGFIVEETGERAKIPRYAGAHLKALVGTRGWG